MSTPAAVDGGDFAVCDRLRGHKGQVLCVAAPEPKAGAAVVATGAEDSTVRLWDLRDGDGAAAAGSSSSSSSSSSRVAHCLCRCFGGEAVTSVVFGAGGASSLFCSAGGKVLEFDLRAGSGSCGLIVTSPTAVLDDGEEEVNELAIHPKGEYLAAADDSGAVKIYSTTTRRVHKTLKNAHMSICHAVRFRPRTSWDIVSGALDSTLAFWDFSSGRVRRKLNLVEDMESSSASASSSSVQQLFNPPFVYSVDFSADGRFLAAGLGDSGVVVLDAKTRAPIGRCDGHSAPICQVHYPCFDSKLLTSSGNDRRLLVWDHRPFHLEAESSPANGGAGTAASSAEREEGRGGGSGGGCKLHSGGKKKSRKKDAGKSAVAAAAAAAAAAAKQAHERRLQESAPENNGVLRPGGRREEGGRISCSVPLLAMRLEEKPNWMTSLTVPYDAMALADTSSEVKIVRIRA